MHIHTKLDKAISDGNKGKEHTCEDPTVILSKLTEILQCCF